MFYDFKQQIVYAFHRVEYISMFYSLPYKHMLIYDYQLIYSWFIFVFLVFYMNQVIFASIWRWHILARSNWKKKP